MVCGLSLSIIRINCTSNSPRAAFFLSPLATAPMQMMLLFGLLSCRMESRENPCPYNLRPFRNSTICQLFPDDCRYCVFGDWYSPSGFIPLNLQYFFHFLHTFQNPIKPSFCFLLMIPNFSKRIDTA